MSREVELDRAFAALADPTRRALIASLSDGDAHSVSQLAQPFEMSLPAVMKHLAVLEGAGLVKRKKAGRTVYCRLEPEPMSQAVSWLEEMQAFWSGRLDALARFVESDAGEAAATSKPPASRNTRKASTKGKGRKRP